MLLHTDLSIVDDAIELYNKHDERPAIVGVLGNVLEMLSAIDLDNKRATSCKNTDTVELNHSVSSVEIEQQRT